MHSASEETLNGDSERLHLRNDYHRCIPTSHETYILIWYRKSSSISD